MKTNNDEEKKKKIFQTLRLQYDLLDLAYINTVLVYCGCGAIVSYPDGKRPSLFCVVLLDLWMQNEGVSPSYFENSLREMDKKCPW